MAKVKGLANWCYLTALDTKFDPCWRVELHVTKEEAEKLKAVGIKPTLLDTDSDYKYSVNIKRHETRKKTGGKNQAPRVVDSSLQPFTEIIGNGSEVVVQYGPYNWEFKGKKGVSMDLQAVQVLNLVKYVASNETVDELEAGESKIETKSDDLEF